MIPVWSFSYSYFELQGSRDAKKKKKKKNIEHMFSKVIVCFFFEKLYLTLNIKHSLNPIQDGPFRGCSRMGSGGLQKGPPL